MKRVYIADSFVKKDPNFINRNPKTYRYFLFIIEQINIIDDKYYLIGFGIGTNANRKYITKRSITILFYTLTKLLIMSEDIIYIKQNIYYTVDIGNLSDSNIIKKIKEKHKIEVINKEFTVELEDDIVNDFLYYFYGKKK